MLDPIIEIAWEASRLIMEIYDGVDLQVRAKQDASPITQADEASHSFITRALRETFMYPVVSEEDQGPREVGSDPAEFWLVDPLDGTKDFVACNGEFTVNIALIRDYSPVLGVVAIPAQGRIYYASEGEGAYKLESKGATPKRIQNERTGPATIGLESRFHSSEETLALYRARAVSEVLQFGSSIKLCKLAEGEADVYVRHVGTSEWDTAAGHAILREANCSLLELRTGRELAYQKAPDWKNSSFVAAHDRCVEHFLAIESAT